MQQICILSDRIFMPQPARGHHGLLLFVITLLFLVAWGAWYLVSPVVPPQLPVDVTISPGQSLGAVANRLEERGLVPDRWRFIILARATGQASAIKAGVYRVTAPMTPPQLLRLLTEGQNTVAAFTIIEGWNWRQVRAALQNADFLRHDASFLDEADLARQLELPGDKVEGWLFPDTYHVARGSSELLLLRRARDTMRQRLDRAWQRRVKDLPLASPYEALTLASIVEKETGDPADRRLVAAVFVNRLRQNMRLQTDPTVIYGLGESFDGNLRKADLQRDTPYNSYTRAGLPPSPIAMPGLASIEAVLDPAPSDALYFVARGDGRSEFSATLDAHNRAVDRYQRRRQP